MHLQSILGIVTSAFLCSLFMVSQCSAYSLQFYGPIRRDFATFGPQPGHFVRPQRSIYGSGWNGGGIGYPISPIGLGQITKDELIALLEAWKEIESGAEEKPQAEAEPEPEEEAEPEPAEQPAKGQGQEMMGPPPGVPLTVSLPAFVPIQLSAMYTAPVPAGAGAGGGAGAGAGASMKAPESAAEPEEPKEPAEPMEPQKPVKEIQQTFFKIFAQPKPAPMMMRGGQAPKKNSGRAKGSVKSPPKAPKPRFFSAPPPPFLAHAPGPLKLVPSSQLLSNWR